MSSTPTPFTTCAAYEEMARKWDLIHDLLGGTATMRAAGKKWLPQEPNEEVRQYQNRLERSFLYGVLGDTIDKIVSKPFSRPIVLTKPDSLPEALQDIERNVDGTGRDLTQFVRDVFRAGVTYGLTHVLVDYPSVEENLTLADERERQIRPVFVHIKPTQLIAFPASYTPAGLQELESIRFIEERTEPEGEFGEKKVRYVRYYNRTEWRVYREEPNGSVTLVRSGRHSFGRVPLRTVYFNQTGFMTGDPPLEDLAYMNLAHWQSYSDHRNILRFVRVGLLFIKGMTEQEIQKGVVIGPGRIIFSKSENADARYVETSGAAISAGFKDLETIEERMEALGNQPLISRTGNQTATGQAIDEARTQTDIRAWVRTTRDFIRLLYSDAAAWVKEELDDGFSVGINDDFGTAFRGGEDMPNLLTMRQTGDLSQRTFLQEAQRRGVIDEELSIEEEIERIQTEAPRMLGEPEPDESEEPEEEPDDAPTEELEDDTGIEDDEDTDRMPDPRRRGRSVRE